MNVKQYDDFSGSGALGSLSYWATSASSSWNLSGSYCDNASSFDLDARAVHQTDANLGLPRSFLVSAEIRMEPGVKYAGVSVLQPATAGSTGNQVVFRWRREGVQQYQIIAPGVATQTVAAPTDLAEDGSTLHRLALNCVYSGSNGSTPSYWFVGYANGVRVMDLGPIQLTYWQSTYVYAGMVGRRETFGVPSPALQFNRWWVEDTARQTHEPLPALEPETLRTGIVPSDETPNTSPATFPLDLRTAEVRALRSGRRMLADLGYATTSPRASRARRGFSCTWVGNGTDMATLEAFFDARTGADDNFTVTIPVMGVGSVSVGFASSALTKVRSAPGVWRVSFDLVELT